MEENKEEKKTFKERKQEVIEWAKAHKKELSAIGISLVAVIASILFARSNVDLESILNKVKIKTAKTNPISDLPDFESVKPKNTVPVLSNPISEISAYVPKSPHTRSGHTRTLHEGWHASPQKIEEARNIGISLAENQTWVNETQVGA